MAASWRERYATNKNLFSKTLLEYYQKPSLKVYLELILSLLTISIFGIFAIRPTITTIGKLVQEIKAKEITITTMDTKIANLTIAQATYNNEKTNIELLKTAIPDSPEPQNFVRQIESLTSESSVTLRNLTLGEVKLIENGVSTSRDVDPSLRSEGVMTISLTLQGSYTNLMNFLNQLENLRRPVKVKSFELTLASLEGNDLTLNAGGITIPYIKIGAPAAHIQP
jgi:Tfp pilus assembly protein PilO